MLKEIIGFFIFCIILFLYLHVTFHLKTSNDLEIFEIDKQTKEIFEEICDFRQPVLFDNDVGQNQIILTTNKDYLSKNYSAFEIKIRDTQNTYDDTYELYAPVALQFANELFKKDSQSIYFSENNHEFLQETGIIKNIQQHDESLRPFLNSLCMYDILLGSSNTVTPFRYNINYRNFFIVTQGSVQIKLTPPKSSRYLYPIYDYENFEFKSPVNPWCVQPEYSKDFEKVKCIDITLVPGKCFYIPSYWWHSFKFSKDTSVCCFYYRTYMSTVAVCPEIIMYFLQNQNIKRSVAKKKMEINIPSESETDMKDEDTNTNTNTNTNTDNA
jgi:hypothetical protein